MKPELSRGFPAGGPHPCRETIRKGWSGPRQLTLLALVLLAACSGLDGLKIPLAIPVSTLTPLVEPESTPTPGTTAEVTPTRNLLEPGELTIWLPPEFDPQEKNPAAELLKQRLDEFEKANSVALDVRLKAVSGPSSLLDSLSAASAAAPMALPGVVALSRPDLETAALKGLLVSLDGLSTAIDDPDWYNYARDLALVQGATFSLPFAGDGLVLVYRPAKVKIPLVTWEDALKLDQPLAFPAGSPLSLTTVALYRSVGGEVEDAQRRPTLHPEKLAEVLDLYRQGAARGIFPVSITQYETDAQVWQAYQDGRVNVCITWMSAFLSARLPDSLVLPLPVMRGQASTLATGWGWAVADPLPERRAMSVHLMEWLTDAKFLAMWTEAAGFLPTRPASMDAWKDQTLKTVLGQVAVSANARPSSDIITSLGPVLEEAAVKVIRLEAEPSQAAAQAAERLLNPQTR
jgi:multiple sugar transport system substrate-binding protein